MIRLSRILSRRRVKHRPSWHLVFEWEDEIARTLGVPVRAPGRPGWWTRSLARRLGVKCPHRTEAPMLEFVMIATDTNRGRYGHRSVPWIIDYFLPDGAVESFLKATAECPYVLISSREAYEHVIKRGGDPAKYLHLPLSLPDRYRLDPTVGMHKDIDLALVGRPTSVLLEFARRYVESHPGLRVVVKGAKRGGHPWVYDLDGNPVADVDSREDYLALLRRCRLFLYSTPGMDDGKPTEGFSQVTPRFLEALACGCVPLMRYPDNPDTRYYDLASFGQSIDTYEQFEAAADRALAAPADLKSIAEYLEPHYTSSVVKTLLEKH
ncbi:MAG: glycosyltransferase family 1 protein [Duncaniella sp.]|nr:glycosyltransferase family 1 protein [Duncaniella sp.]